MDLGRRDRVPFPATHGEYRLVRTHGRVFALPVALDPELILAPDDVRKHPAALSGATLDEVREKIDAADPRSAVPEVVGRHAGHDLVRLGGSLLAVPHPVPPADLHRPEERRRVGAITAPTERELKAAVARAEAAEPVEFAGWLPVYEQSGNCGKHPQFAHTGNPPDGYRFTCSAPPPPYSPPSRWERLRTALHKKADRVLGLAFAVARVLFAFVRPRRGVTLRARGRVFAAMVRLVVTLLRRGCRPVPILKFLQTRNLQSQLLVGDQRGVVFLTSMPYTFGQNPWVIEIEDPTTLFYPLIQNGNTGGLDIKASPFLPIIKALLEADHCKAILTHIRSTAELLPALFESEVIARKVVYSPLGVKVPARWQRHDPRPPDEPIELLFINSWCQVPENFFVRGGLDVLEAFATLRVRYPQLRLTLRTHLPALDDHYHRIMENWGVRVIDRFLTAEEMAELHASSHVFLLPAARVHIVSLLQAMSYGLAVVGSDGWGMEEYLEDGRNGLVVRGRHGVTSWADPQDGLLREDYEPTYTPDPRVVEGIVEAVSRLVEDAELRRRLGHAARQDVKERYNLDGWNAGLKKALDRATGKPETEVNPAGTWDVIREPAEAA